MSTAIASAETIRALQHQDLDAVVAIDAALSGRARRTYFERRLKAALDQPELHMQLAPLEDAGRVAGCMLARRTLGEFGRTASGLRLEVMGVRADGQGRGAGRALLQAMLGWGRGHGVAELRTIATWNDHTLLRWLDANGFTLAPDQILDCSVDNGWQAEHDDALELPDARTPGHEIDYGAPEGNDFQHNAHRGCDVQTMRPEDLRAIVRTDRQITDTDRQNYIEGKLDEAMTDSGVRMSLTARLDGAIIGFLMARADHGDFGRSEPVAVFDTIGVDPGYGRMSVAHALVSQLFANLSALHIGRIEAVLTPTDHGLRNFLTGVGFRPTQRLAFRLALG